MFLINMCYFVDVFQLYVTFKNVFVNTILEKIQISICVRKRQKNSLQKSKSCRIPSPRKCDKSTLLSKTILLAFGIRLI